MSTPERQVMPEGQPTDPSIGDLAAAWRETWVSPKTGPNYLRPQLFAMVDLGFQETEAAENHAYAMLIMAAAETIVASPPDEQGGVIDHALRAVLSPPHQRPLNDGVRLEIVTDLFKATLAVKTHQAS